VIGSGFLTFEDFKRLVDKNPFVREIELSNWGEVTINPQLPQILRYAHQRNITINVANGTNLNDVEDELLESLVKNGVQNITVSLDGASQDAYQKYRVGGNFEKVIDNIKKINFYKQKYETNHPHLTWQFIIFGHNEHEIKEAKKIAKKLKMAFSPKLNFSSSFSPVVNKEQVMVDAGILVTSRNEYREKFAKNYLPVCFQLWVAPQINWDGKIMGCCSNYWSDFGGNAFREGLDKCLNSYNIAYARNMLQGKMPRKNGIPCSDCNVYLDMANERNWLKMADIMKKHYVFSKFKRFPFVYNILRLIKRK